MSAVERQHRKQVENPPPKIDELQVVISMAPDMAGKQLRQSHARKINQSIEKKARRRPRQADDNPLCGRDLFVFSPGNGPPEPVKQYPRRQAESAGRQRMPEFMG